ncbi:MAG: protein translocase subunit SecF [Chloroflexi bacterium]|nr:protein translocase subunit SecF [Chloroflexota bacterium]
MWDIVGKRYWYFLLSSLIVIPGIISLSLYGLPLSIDFTGGSLLELEYKGTDVPGPGEMKEVFDSFGFQDTLVQTSGERIFLVRSKFLDSPTKQAIEDSLREQFGDFEELRFEAVGPAVSQEVQQRAVWAVGLAAFAILLYISWAFRHVPNPIRFGTCAIVAMLHDVFVVLGLASIFGVLFGLEVDALFLTALLTVIGFSVHDTIVVFDRIRENSRRRAGEPLPSIVNHSIIQTLDRSINTQLTVVFTLVALLLFGGITIRYFVLILLIGIISGTYSSIFNASPLLVEWEAHPHRLLYALSFALPPLGLLLGAYNWWRGKKPWARGSLLAAGIGLVSIALLFIGRMAVT